MAVGFSPLSAAALCYCALNRIKRCNFGSWSAKVAREGFPQFQLKGSEAAKPWRNGGRQEERAGGSVCGSSGNRRGV